MSTIRDGRQAEDLPTAGGAALNTPKRRSVYPELMFHLVRTDDGEGYSWRLVETATGALLATGARYATRKEAKRALGTILHAAGTAMLEDRS